MPAERVAMRQAREIIHLKFSACVPTREIARRLGIGCAAAIAAVVQGLPEAGFLVKAVLIMVGLYYIFLPLFRNFPKAS